jgi:hypothetical protein
VDTAIAYIEAIHDGVAQRTAALDYSAAHEAAYRNTVKEWNRERPGLACGPSFFGGTGGANLLLVCGLRNLRPLVPLYGPMKVGSMTRLRSGRAVRRSGHSGEWVARQRAVAFAKFSEPRALVGLQRLEGLLHAVS